MSSSDDVTDWLDAREERTEGDRDTETQEEELREESAGGT